MYVSGSMFQNKTKGKGMKKKMGMKSSAMKPRAGKETEDPWKTGQMPGKSPRPVPKNKMGMKPKMKSENISGNQRVGKQQKMMKGKPKKKA
jgi:hypothetical protein